jgi:hypothetical protein
MQRFTVGLVGVLVLSCGGAMLFSVLWGQEQPATPERPRENAAPPAHGRDLSDLPPLRKQMHLAAQRGLEWLHRANGPDGRFIYGYVPALKTTLDGDHYLRQAGAAFALARAARYLGDDRHAARARQAVLTLLSDTAVDPRDPKVRMPTLPAIMVNHLAAAGMLLLAIHELPDPAEDLLQQSDQLAEFIRRQQQANGSLAYGDPKTDPDGINYYPGEALHGLMLSQRHRPAAWKNTVARKALDYYRPWWQEHKNMAFVPWQTAAFTEAFLRTKEQAFADFVFEMNDWLCELQYPLLDARHPLWGGGFMGWHDGKVLVEPPQIGTASYAESLAEACRTARAAADLGRYPRYRQALERALQFIARLQYTEANTQHFSDWYRPALVGAFHASPQDGNLRVDYTQHAVCALVQYLENVPD